jgi:lipoprotein signal peptidase
MHRISSSFIGASLILPLPLIYISWLILGDTAPAETSQDVLKSIWIIGLSLIDVAIAAAAVHLLVADLHRSNAAAASLLLLILVWPFIELTDALTIILNDGMTFGLGMEEPFTMILLASLTSVLIWLVAVFLPDV